jgi:hypothetical protein
LRLTTRVIADRFSVIRLVLGLPILGVARPIEQIENIDRGEDVAMQSTT